MSGRPLPGLAEFAVEYSDEWYTPAWITDALGRFDLDPCSPLDRPRDIAARHLTLEDDGLTARWEGRIWLNPPYSTVASWVAKLAVHGDGTALVFARTETAWWQEVVWRRASAILFLRGRVGFESGTGRQLSHTPAPSALVAFGQRDASHLRRSGLSGALVAGATVR